MTPSTSFSLPHRDTVVASSHTYQLSSELCDNTAMSSCKAHIRAKRSIPKIIIYSDRYLEAFAK